MDKERTKMIKWQVVDFIIECLRMENENMKTLYNELHNLIVSLDQIVSRMENLENKTKEREQDKVMFRYYETL